MANDENTTDKDLPWYKDVYNYATSPEFLRKPTKEESIDTAKGSIKQIGSFYNDLIGLGYNALDLGGIIPGVGKDDPNFGLLDFFGNMIKQKRQGEFNVPLSEVLGNPEFLEYTNNLNSSVIRDKEHDMQKRFDKVIAQTGVDVELIPEDIRRNAFRDENSAAKFLQEIRSLGGVNLDDNSSMELDDLMNKFIMRENNYEQFYRDNSIMKVDWSDEENPMVTFGNMPKVDHGFFGLDMTLDPGYTSEGDLSLTNLGKYRMVDGKLTRVQPSVQNWLSDWNENPDRFGGILQSTPGYEALGNMIDDKVVKNVAWQGHDFDFPKGIESQAEKEGFLMTMYPLMAQGAVSPISKLVGSRPGKMTTGIGGTTVAASLPNVYEEPE